LDHRRQSVVGGVVMAHHRWDVLAVASLLGSALFAALVYERLPDLVPTHFDLSGQPNGWMPKALAAWGIPLFGFAMWAFVRFVNRVIPRSDRKRLSETHVAVLSMLTAMFLASVQVVVLYAATVPGAAVIRPTFLLVSALFVALGLIMPRLRRNPI